MLHQSRDQSQRNRHLQAVKKIRISLWRKSLSSCRVCLFGVTMIVLAGFASQPESRSPSHCRIHIISEGVLLVPGE